MVDQSRAASSAFLAPIFLAACDPMLQVETPDNLYGKLFLRAGLRAPT